jgi:hypothetical protein
MKASWLIAILIGACGGGGGASKPTTPKTSDVEADFKMICEEAERAAAMPDVDARRTSYATAVEAKLKTDAARNTFKAAGAEAPEKVEATLAQGAAESGVPNWSCAAIAPLYGAKAP